MPETKKCCKCKEEKPLDEFNRRKRSPDGRQTYCRECHKDHYRANKERYLQQANEWTERNREKRYAASRRYKQRNPKKVSRWNREYRERHPESGKRNLASYYEKHPLRKKANRAVRKAIQTGRLKKPGHCERCLAPKESGQLDGHHPDYKKFLEVLWLCRQCHVDAHKEERGEAPRTEPAPSFRLTS